MSLVFMYLLAVVGFSSVVVGASSQVAPPKPATAIIADSKLTALDVILKKPQPKAEAKPVTVQNIASPSVASVLPASPPERITIPSINVSSPFIQVGKENDGSVEVPKGDDYDKAAWYKHSVTPGENGSSVVLGHVDSAFTGPSIFFNLGALKVNDTIFIDRADGTKVEFKIDLVKEYSKADFPTADVYGDSAGSTLKLITCSGAFDKASGEYQNNVIVFASKSNL